MSNYAEQLKKKIQLHKDTNFVDIGTDIEELLSLANQASEKYKEQKDEIEDYELRESVPFSDIKSYATKEFGLLGVQCDEAFSKALFHQNTNQVKLLQVLEGFAKSGYSG